jgi:small-conductance mechanosensitive channel
VGYYSDLDHVERVTVEVAREVTEETEGAIPLSDYEPSVWYTEFGDSNINFWVVLRSQGFLESWLLKHNFIKALFRRYNELGIEISFPNSNVFFRDGPAGPSLAEMPVTATGNAAALKSPRARPRGRAPARIPGEVGQGESAPDLPDVPG